MTYAKTYEDYTEEMLEWAKDDIDEMIDYLILHYDNFDDMFYNCLLNTDIIAPYDDYWLTEEEAAETISELIDNDYIAQGFYYRLGLKNSSWKNEDPRIIDAWIRELALHDVSYELEKYYDQVVEDHDEYRAQRYLMDHAHISEDTAQFLIEWWADEPMPWAEMYAPYIRELTNEDADPETWEKHHPYDLVIEDAGFNAPAVIISEDIVNYY